MAKGKGGFIGQDGINAPDQATGVTGTTGDTSVSVAFTAPSDVGGSAITEYRAQSNDGIGASGSASPITVTGLTNGTSYTFNVWAINPFGWSSPSDASDAVVPANPPFVLFGSGNGSNRIQRINASTTGNAEDFGDLTSGRTQVCSFSSATRGCWAQGFQSNIIDYVTIQTLGNATDFGDGQYASLTLAAGFGNSTRGIIAGGNQTGTKRNRIQYVTIASTGNAAEFGNLAAAADYITGCASPTRGITMGDSADKRRVQYITIGSTGNASDFGDLSVNQDAGVAFSNSTRGVVAHGGYNSMEYVTIASTGNGTDFGDLINQPRGVPGGSAGNNRGIVGGGYDNALPGQTNVIQYVDIASTGNATDFGDLIAAAAEFAACGSAHGGIS